MSLLAKMPDYGFSERRNKKKDKYKERKRHPYRLGGNRRTLGKGK